MRRSSAALLRDLMFTAVLAVPVLLSSVSQASAASAPLNVAVVKSDIVAGATVADGSAVGSHSRRVDNVVSLLRRDADDNLTVTVIGDDDLSNVATLRDYDVVVLVRHVATIESQRLALRQYVADGGGLVSMFSTSRYDYRPGYPAPYRPGYASSGTPYWQFNFWWGFAGSSFMSQSFQYGELSELFMTKFCNDPLFQPNYRLSSSGRAHPILQMTAADIGTSVGGVTFTDPNPQYNETVWPIKNAPLTALLNFSNERVGDAKVGIESLPTKYGAASHMAAWAAPYHYGKVAAYGFQLYDLTSQPAAARMLVNSVKWAGTHETFGAINKTPDVAVNAWYTRGQIWATAQVSNPGNIQLRGRLKAEYFKPGASTPFASCWIKDPAGYIPVSPGESYKDTAGANPSVSPTTGRWRVRVSYTYYDYFRGGWVAVYRDGNLDGTGKGMTWRGQSGLYKPSSTHTAPAGSKQIAGGDRYSTGVELSKAGWPNGIDTTNRAVILASGAGYADALAAAPLAGKLNAPILLTSPTALPSSVSAELARLFAPAPAGEVAKLYVAGAMPSAVVEAARSAIASAGAGRPVEIVSLAGASRYDTAKKIALEIGSSPVQGWGGTAFIVTGSGYADALSAAPVAARLRIPILFVSSEVPAATEEALDALDIRKCIIVGSTSAVSAAVETALEGDGHRAAADPRLQGGTRYDTGLRVMEFGKANAGFSEASLYVATGANYPDALALAPVAAAKQTSVLLVNGSDMAYSPASGVYLLGRRSARPPVTFVGSTAAVSGWVRGQMGVALTP